MYPKDESIEIIECNYHYKGVACCFLMVEGDEAAFIENNTNHAVPQILQSLEERGLKPENVRYLIITHVHLDHAGSTSNLVQKFPNATVIAHPKAATHIINPSRLLESAMSVYGKESFERIYGTILPVPESRVRTTTDNEEIVFGSRKLKFIHTLGHANHHHVVHDSLTNSVFTGDSFGLGYARLQRGSKPFLFPSSSPTDFDPQKALESVDKIINTGARRAYLTHYGSWDNMQEGANQLKTWLNFLGDLLYRMRDSDVPDADLYKKCYPEVKAYMDKEVNIRNLVLDKEEENMLNYDVDLNSQGIVYVATKLRKKK